MYIVIKHAQTYFSFMIVSHNSLKYKGFIGQLPQYETHI